MKSSETKFIAPNYDIDDLIYFSDITISKEPIMIQYQELISEGRYNDALDLIQDVDYYGSWILNLLENRDVEIYGVLEPLVKPVFGVYQNTEPTSYGEEDIFIWID